MYTYHKNKEYCKHLKIIKDPIQDRQILILCEITYSDYLILTKKLLEKQLKAFVNDIEDLIHCM